MRTPNETLLQLPFRRPFGGRLPATTAAAAAAAAAATATTTVIVFTRSEARRGRQAFEWQRLRRSRGCVAAGVGLTSLGITKHSNP